MSAPRLYLITPTIDAPAAFIAPFEAALTAGDIACVLLRTADAAIVRRLAAIAQRRCVACLVGDPHLAVQTDCDGVHVEGVGPQLETALASMKPGAIVGAGSLASRHDAMTAGEAGVDYLMFGGPGKAYEFEEVRERTAWWGEIFNPPCVAYARVFDEIAPLARAGADFVALCDAIWCDPRGPAAGVEEAGRLLAAAREPAA
jgi:thiamine-phosphate pyrophosphorylase